MTRTSLDVFDLQASKVATRRLRLSQFSMVILECKMKLERG